MANFTVTLAMKPTSYLLATTLFIALSSCKKDVMLPPSDLGFPFEKTIGGVNDDIANSIIYSDGYLMILGTTKSNGDEKGDLYLVKMDLNGNVVWEKTYGSSLEEEGVRIIETSNGDYMLVGAVKNNSIYRDFYLVRVNKKGEQLWEQNYGGDLDDIPTDIIELADGSFTITGGTQSYGAGSIDLILLKIDGDGMQIGQRVYGGVDLDFGTRFAPTLSDEIMLLGFTNNFGEGDRDFYLLKIDNQGDTIFSKTYGGSAYDEPKSIVQLHNGNYLLHGHSASTRPEHDVLSFVVNQSGDVIWQKEFGGTEHDGGQTALQDKKNNLVLIAESNSFGNDRQIYLVKTDIDGQVLTEKTFGGAGDDFPLDVVEAGSSYFIVGMTNSMGAGGYDMYIIKEKR